MKRQNEHNAAEAVAQIMSLRTSIRYTVAESPDDANSATKEVDFIVAPELSSVPKIAVEHTIVEAFKGQMTYVKGSFDIVCLIAAECSGKLPIDRYFILVLTDVLVDFLRKKAVPQFVGAAVGWILEAAPKLSTDEYRKWDYEGSELLLMCGGSHPEINGTIGRIPRRPDQQENLAVESLWRGIHHGLVKFAKYKGQGYETVMCLEDISGEVHPWMLSEIAKDADRGPLIEHLMDYLIVFASVKDQMVVGNIWKEKKALYNPPPFNRRFQNHQGYWKALGRRVARELSNYSL